MTLGEKLEELRNNVLRDRSDLIAGDTDSLWSDETLLRYIKDGERRFARQSLIIHDATTASVCQVQMTANVATYPLHPSVLGVLSARYDTNTWDLLRSGRGILLNDTPADATTFDPTAGYSVPPGPPTAYYTDETLVYGGKGRVTLSTYPVPGTDQAGKIISMRVLRLPLQTYTLSDLDVESEIPEDYELDTLEWAAYRALRGFDADAGAADIAEKHRTQFYTAVAEAVKETKRKIFGNVGFRFGQSGFSWER